MDYLLIVLLSLNFHIRIMPYLNDVSLNFNTLYQSFSLYQAYDYMSLYFDKIIIFFPGRRSSEVLKIKNENRKHKNHLEKIIESTFLILYVRFHGCFKS